MQRKQRATVPTADGTRAQAAPRPAPSHTSTQRRHCPLPGHALRTPLRRPQRPQIAGKVRTEPGVCGRVSGLGSAAASSGNGGAFGFCSNFVGFFFVPFDADWRSFEALRDPGPPLRPLCGCMTLFGTFQHLTNFRLESVPKHVPTLAQAFWRHWWRYSGPWFGGVVI